MSILITKTVKNGCQTTIPFNELSLKDIPCIMEKMKWYTAASLMNHWFSYPESFKFTPEIRDKFITGPSINIPSDRVNTTIVTMTWAQKFEQVVESIAYLKNNWASAKGKDRLFNKIYNINKINKINNKIFVGQSNNIIELDYSAQINIKTFGNNKFGDINELKGAIGVGSLKLIVRGYFDIASNKKIFFVEKIGFYIKDTYDFTDENDAIISEPLGIWSRDGVLNRIDTIAYMSRYATGAYGILYSIYKDHVPVFNEDFRKWQDTHHTGGDFVIFSDIYWTDPQPTDRVIYEMG